MLANSGRRLRLPGLLDFRLIKMEKIWLLYLGYFILLFTAIFIIFRIQQRKVELRDYNLWWKIVLSFKIRAQKIINKIYHPESLIEFKESLVEKILRRIKIEALKIENFANDLLEKRKIKRNGGE